jgi:hypothetical protein
MVEQRIENPRVGGSIPSLGTSLRSFVKEQCPWTWAFQSSYVPEYMVV